MRGTLTKNALLVLFLTGCSSESELKPFTSDGCSLFPDSSLISENDWCSCCFEHDIQYWRGGTQEDRETADRALQQCVADKTGNMTLARMMYEGVSVGGSPYFYNWYRWGYGWGYERKYQPLTGEELENANRLLQEYVSGNAAPVCPAQ